MARLGLVAAVLATLLILAPAASAAETAEYSYPENGEDPVATFSASDPDADADDIEWSLEGVDKAIFKISDDGVLTFDKSPDFEDAKDDDESDLAGDQGKGDNVYKVTVVASDGELDVVVTVTNVNESGKVTFTQPQPQVTRDLMAKLVDNDGTMDLTWQWSRGSSADGPWAAIAGATTASRSPVAADVGSYLQATATYTDSFGAQTVSGVAGNAVETRTLANAAPKFPDIDPIEAKEGVKGAIGDPITATDADNDHLLYDKGEVDEDDEPGADANDNALFNVSSGGQISLKDELDYENPGTGKTANALDSDDDIPDGVIVYTVVVKAEDPSGASTPQAVMVYLKDVNEAPEFPKATRDRDTLYITENVTETALTIRSDEASTAGVPDAYTANDDDNKEGTNLTANTVDAVTYDLEGDDSKYFTIGAADGALGVAEALSVGGANYEKKSSYTITIVAESTGSTDTDRDTKYGKMDVTIKVVNVEDIGTVTFSAREPQFDRSVIAKLTDEDGGEASVKWQWYRGGGGEDGSTSSVLDADRTVSTDANTACADGNLATADAPCKIDGANSAVYTPDEDDDGHRLQVVASYKDAIATDDSENAVGITERAVQDSNPANTAPAFPDQDFNTPGDQSDTAMRSVIENKKDAMVGEPIEATDDNNDLLTYSISGADASAFTIGSGLDDETEGQLKTATELDYETKSEYQVVVTAADPSGAYDMITVTITVTDGPDGAVITGVKAVDYSENGEDPVATFSASDPDADADDIEWSLEGADKAIFKISDDGVLTFDKSPDFEDAKDDDESDLAGDQGKGDNVYKVTVMASDGELDVVVTVTNVNESGKVTFTQPQPQVTRDLMAKLVDNDGTMDLTWQWSRGSSADGPWAAIAGATTASRSPVAADVGSYLQATATYTDSFGAQTVSGVAGNAVETRTLANAAPKFPDIDPIEAKEGVKGAIGDPITATDADNDHLLYDKGEVDEDDEPGADANDNALFNVSSGGQISLKDELDYENPGTGKTANALDSDDDIPDGVIVYTVVVKAEDPSGASTPQAVMVYLKDVNEAPEFPKATRDRDTLYITENVTETALTIRSDEASTAGVPDAYTANDDDNKEGTNLAAGTVDTVTYDLEGDDSKYFTIGAADGALGVAEALSVGGANYEKKSSYTITIVAESTGSTDTDRDTKYGKMDVTIKVVNVEDIGTVTFSAREPQFDRSVIAKLTDEDGGEASVKWQWYRGGGGEDGSTSSVLDADRTVSTDANTACADGNLATADAPCKIDGANSAVYTPDEDDDGHRLQVVASYKDAIATDDSENAVGITERAVQDSNPANTAPAFPDQDLNTPGDQSDTAMRSVIENKKDAMVGEPIEATDDNNDLLTYSISGADASAFTIGSGLDDETEGQLKTATELDYETKSEYQVVVTAADPSGAYDMITVTITVTDGPDGAVITLGPAVNNPPAFDLSTASRSVDENMAAGTIVGDSFTATDDPGDTVIYSLSSMSFKIDDMGQITTTMMLDHEAMSSHMVTVTATDLEGATDTVDVTIMVGDMYPGCTVMDNNGLTTDCEMLLEAKMALGGSLDWTDHADNPITSWEGVTVSGDPMRVTGVWLKGKGLDGTIPAVLNRVEMLTVLNLHSNNLSGPIPDLSGTMLEQLYLARNYDEDVADSGLTGGVPVWLNDMTGMTHLWLWGNMLDGSIPDLSGMTSLVELKLNSNMLSGGVPMADMLPPNATWILLQKNPLGGTIPDLSSLTNLRILWLHTNELTGSIPATLPTSVTSVNLKGNSLSGMIPDLSGLQNLQWLRLQRNQLSGDIPGTLGDLGSVTKIWLYENQLTGIGTGFGNAADTLTDLFLTDNPFAEGTCLPGDLADVANNDFEMAGLAACPN